MTTQHQNQTLALAGVFQAAHLVHQIATTGQTSATDFEVCMRSIFNQNPASTLDVFGGDMKNLETGLKSIKTLLSSKNQHDIRHSRASLNYVLGVLQLESKLKKDTDMMSTLGKRLEHTDRQATMLSYVHDDVSASLSQLYQDTLSTFKFRIHVTGDSTYLKNTYNANKIRALLLAGVRSARLWRQVGGRRWKLLFSRGKVLETAEVLLKQC